MILEDDGTSAYLRAPFSDIQDEAFAFEKTDVVNEHTVLEGCEVSDAAMEAVTPDVDDFLKIDSRENLLPCCRCGSEYYVDELVENENNLCPQCKQNEEFSNPHSLIRLEMSQNVTAPLTEFEESHITKSTLVQSYTDSKDISQTALRVENKTLEIKDQVNELSGICLEISLSISLGEESFKVLPEKQITGEHTTVNDQENEMHKYSDKTNRNISMAEGAGMSVLLNRSSSLEGPLVLGRTINSSAISYDDLSYARDLTSSMRSSIGHGSISTTSSIDLTSTRHGEVVVQRQMSSKRSDASSKPQSTGSSFSGTSTTLHQGFGLSMSSRDGSCEGSVSNLRHIAGGEFPGSPSDRMELHDAVTCVSAVMHGEDNNMICTNFREKGTLFVANNIVTSGFDDKRQTCEHPDVGHIVHEFEGSLKRIGNIQNLGEMALIDSSMAEENRVQDNSVDQGGAAEDHVQCSPKSPIDVVSREEFEDPSSTTHYNEDGKHSSLNFNEISHVDGIEEEFRVTVEEQEGRTRSMTLEEATDTILFCSLIIHDLAYKAATIEIEKEKENLEPLEGSGPMLTIPERRSSERKDAIPHGVSSGRTPKTNKTRKRRATTEMDAKPPNLDTKCNCTIM